MSNVNITPKDEAEPTWFIWNAFLYINIEGIIVEVPGPPPVVI